MLNLHSFLRIDCFFVEEGEKSTQQKHEALQEKINLLQQEVHAGDSLRAEVGDKVTEM